MPLTPPPPSWQTIKNKPTTVTGFGITDIGIQSVSYASTAGNGGVTSLNGQTGAIINTTLGAIGSVVKGIVSGYYNSGSSFTLGATYTGVQAYTVNTGASGSGFSSKPGTWRCIGGTAGSYVQGGPQANMLQGLFVRIS